MNAIVSLLLVGMVSLSYILQNWIMSGLEEGVSNAWLVFTLLAVVGALLPFLIYVFFSLLLIRRAEK